MGIPMHQELIGKLLYLANRTHTATYFAISYLSQFYHKRRFKYVIFWKKLLRTLKSQRDFFCNEFDFLNASYDSSRTIADNGKNFLVNWFYKVIRWFHWNVISKKMLKFLFVKLGNFLFFSKIFKNSIWTVALLLDLKCKRLKNYAVILYLNSQAKFQ